MMIVKADTMMKKCRPGLFYADRASSVPGRQALACTLSFRLMALAQKPGAATALISQASLSLYSEFSINGFSSETGCSYSINLQRKL
jgi:hypothetical protein